MYQQCRARMLINNTYLDQLTMHLCLLTLIKLMPESSHKEPTLMAIWNHKKKANNILDILKVCSK